MTLTNKLQYYCWLKMKMGQLTIMHIINHRISFQIIDGIKKIKNYMELNYSILYKYTIMF